jgi:hypothetical protein
MTRSLLPSMALCALLLAANTAAHAQDTPPATPATATLNTVAGSTAFCLYELPGDNSDGKRRWLNLGIVQYVEFSRSELKIYYGGGNLGSGHEVRLPAATPAQLDETLNKIKQAAANCR